MTRVSTAWRKKLDADIMSAEDRVRDAMPEVAKLLAVRDQQIAIANVAVTASLGECMKINLDLVGCSETQKTVYRHFLDELRRHPPQFTYPVREIERIAGMIDGVRKGVTPMSATKWEFMKVPMGAYLRVVRGGIAFTAPSFEAWQDADRDLRNMGHEIDELKKMPEAKARQRYDEEILSAEVAILDSAGGGEPSEMLYEWLAMAKRHVEKKTFIPFIPCPPRWFPPLPYRDYKIAPNGPTFAYVIPKADAPDEEKFDTHVAPCDDPLGAAKELLECHRATGENWLQGVYA